MSYPWLVRTLPLLILVGLIVRFQGFDDGHYLLYAHFLHVPTRNVSWYFILSLLLCIYPIIHGCSRSYKLLQFGYSLICFYFIGEIYYRLFSRIRLIDDHQIHIWEKYSVFSLLALLVMQYLLKYTDFEIRTKLLLNLLMCMAALTTVFREMQLLAYSI